MNNFHDPSTRGASTSASTLGSASGSASGSTSASASTSALLAGLNRLQPTSLASLGGNLVGGAPPAADLLMQSHSQDYNDAQSQSNFLSLGDLSHRRLRSPSSKNPLELELELDDVKNLDRSTLNSLLAGKNVSMNMSMNMNMHMNNTEHSHENTYDQQQLENALLSVQSLLRT